MPRERIGKRNSYHTTVSSRNNSADNSVVDDGDEEEEDIRRGLIDNRSNDKSHLHGDEEEDVDPNKKSNRYYNCNNIVMWLKQASFFLERWTGRYEFAKAQAQVVVILLIAYLGNNFPKSYPRNDNHNMTAFWIMNGLLALAAAFTMKHDAQVSNRGVQLLSRAQTEEWKGWMQWAFIMVRLFDNRRIVFVRPPFDYSEFLFRRRPFIFSNTVRPSVIISSSAIVLIILSAVSLLPRLPRVQRNPSLRVGICLDDRIR